MSTSPSMCCSGTVPVDVTNGSVRESSDSACVTWLNVLTLGFLGAASAGWLPKVPRFIHGFSRAHCVVD